MNEDRKLKTARKAVENAEGLAAYNSATESKLLNMMRLRNERIAREAAEAPATNPASATKPKRKPQAPKA